MKYLKNDIYFFKLLLVDATYSLAEMLS